MTDRDRVDLILPDVREAGALALDYFRRAGSLYVDTKGHQDFVSQVDREVEEMLRRALAAKFPEDGIIGEEGDDVAGTSGFRWVIDPIDGTSNFISGLPVWTVVLAGVADGATRVGIIFDPCHDEMFIAVRGGGATLNDEPMELSGATLTWGQTAIGYSTRVETEHTLTLIAALLDAGAAFIRNGSGAISLAHVAAGRFVGYIEEHMNAWDCLAGQLMVVEAGGRVAPYNPNDFIEDGGSVIAAAPGVYEDLIEIADRAFAS